MENTQTDLPKKRKPGYSRKPDGEVTPDALRMRRYQERKSTERLAEQALMEATGAAYKSIIPADSFSDVQQFMAQQAQETARLFAAHGPEITLACIEKAKSGDVGAMSLLLKYIAPAPTTRVKVALPKDATLTDAVNSVTSQMLDGSIPLEHAGTIIAALERGGNVALSSAVLDRLNSLQTRLANISATAPPSLAQSLAFEAIDV